MIREQFIRHVQSTQGALRRFLMALCCGDTALADDIAQESYIKAYLTLDTLNDPEKFKSWIFRIAYNTFIDSKRATRSYGDYTQARDIPSDDHSDSTFNYQELYQALNHLSPKERTSVLLFYIEGYPIKDIAILEKTSVDAVKQHLSRGREHLRGLLSNQKDL